MDVDLLGCPVSDCATGRLLGRVKSVAYDPPGGVCRLLVECYGEPRPWAAEDPLWFGVDRPDPRPYQDYMVGQFAAVTLVDPHGRVIVEVGAAITPQVLDHARRCGLLHRLSAVFRV